MRELLEPLIGGYGSISMFLSRIGPVAFSMAEQKKLTGVEVRSDGLVRLEREHGGRDRSRRGRGHIVE